MVYETNLAENGSTTVPKAMRDALDIPRGCRLRWELLTDGSLRVIVKHKHSPPAHLDSQEADSGPPPGKEAQRRASSGRVIGIRG